MQAGEDLGVQRGIPGDRTKEVTWRVAGRTRYFSSTLIRPIILGLSKKSWLHPSVINLEDPIRAYVVCHTPPTSNPARRGIEHLCNAIITSIQK